MALKWTTALRNYLILHFKTMTDKEIAHQLTIVTGKKVKPQAVQRTREQMGLRKKGTGDIG